MTSRTADYLSQSRKWLSQVIPASKSRSQKQGPLLPSCSLRIRVDTLSRRATSTYSQKLSTCFQSIVVVVPPMRGVEDPPRVQPLAVLRRGQLRRGRAARLSAAAD